MSRLTPNPKKRDFELPPGCKDLLHLLQGPPARLALHIAARVNGKIRAPEVQVVDERGKPLGIMSLAAALEAAQSRHMDLIEIGPQAQPPLCRLMDHGRFRYEQNKKKKKKTDGH